MPIFCLFVTYASGHVSVLTFDSQFDRALQMVMLSAQPVTLRCVDYEAAA